MGKSNRDPGLHECRQGKGCQQVKYTDCRAEKTQQEKFTEQFGLDDKMKLMFGIVALKLANCVGRTPVHVIGKMCIVKKTHILEVKCWKCIITN
jgi:hypothetical protein